MGNRSSGHSHGVHSDDIFDLHWTASRQKLLKSFLPGYFVDDLPTEEEIDLVKNYWNRIRGGVSDEDCGPEVEDLSLMPEFLAEFHNRLNEICPVSCFYPLFPSLGFMFFHLFEIDSCRLFEAKSSPIISSRRY